jgi:uncharacterized protein YgiM (DUF1202 family)
MRTLKLLLFFLSLSNYLYSQSTGTGFLISNDGYIVTCYHVIEDSKEISVKGINADFQKKYIARIVVTDKINDLAILKINCSLDKAITYSVNWNAIDVGQSVFTLGYPLMTTMGEEIKLTNGIISSKSGFRGDISTYQISVPVQPGNSGGPLFDNKGFVVGVVNAKHTGAENAGYAVKSIFLKNLIQSSTHNISLHNNNLLIGKQLSEQVRLAKDYVLIIEVTQETISSNIASKTISLKAKSEAKIKDKPDVLGKIIGTIPKGTTVEIVGKEQDYWKIFYRGQINYSHTMYFEDSYESFIIKETEKFSKMPPEYQNNNEIATITSNAKMRKSPSPVSDIIQYIPKGKIIYVIGCESSYWKIFYEGKEGYLMDGMYFDVTYNMMRFKKH